ncbi:alpha/beta hydrolase [Aquipuribacter hungaricus]|uniref:Alpha/beta hydrolase n=2 Tax=Aquipuribacter hungaricus TaxID=545624 RepID=A0ABV7WFR0_9MICO
MSLPAPLTVRLVSALGRRTGAVGVAGRDADQVRASRGPARSRTARAVQALVLGAPSPRVRVHRRATWSGVPVAVHTPPVVPGTVLPVVVHLHGGGWAQGGIDDTPWWVAALAEALPAVVVSVGYRLAPEHPFPAAVDDCLEAVRWVAASPGAVGSGSRVRTDRVALVGDSAGANLAAVTSARLRDEPLPGDPRVVHQGLVYPATDARLLTGSMAANAHAPVLGRADVDRFLELYTDGTGVDVEDPRLSPLLAASHAGLPPTTVLTAEHDPLRDDGRLYAERLAAAGVRVRLTDYPGAVHGFLSLAGLDQVRSRQAVAELVAAIRPDLCGAPAGGPDDGPGGRPDGPTGLLSADVRADG